MMGHDQGFVFPLLGLGLYWSKRERLVGYHLKVCSYSQAKMSPFLLFIFHDSFSYSHLNLSFPFFFRDPSYISLSPLPAPRLFLKTEPRSSIIIKPLSSLSYSSLVHRLSWDLPCSQHQKISLKKLPILPLLAPSPNIHTHTQNQDSFTEHIQEVRRSFHRGRRRKNEWRGNLTRRQTLLQLIRLIRILEHERVQISTTSNFELDLLWFAISLYARRCKFHLVLVSYSAGKARPIVLEWIK